MWDEISRISSIIIYKYNIIMRKDQFHYELAKMTVCVNQQTLTPTPMLTRRFDFIIFIGDSATVDLIYV